MGGGGGALRHAREFDSAFDDDISRSIGHIIKPLRIAFIHVVSKQCNLQPVAVVDKAVVQEAAAAGAKHALDKRGADNEVSYLVQHHLQRIVSPTDRMQAAQRSACTSTPTCL